MLSESDAVYAARSVVTFWRILLYILKCQYLSSRLCGVSSQLSTVFKDSATYHITFLKTQLVKAVHSFANLSFASQVDRFLQNICRPVHLTNYMAFTSQKTVIPSLSTVKASNLGKTVKFLVM
jgi:hypothetical protein